MTALTACCRAARLGALLALALTACLDPEIAMADDTPDTIDAVRIVYHGPQDKPVPPLLLSAAPLADPAALTDKLGLSDAEDSFGVLAVTVDEATFAALAGITMDLGGETAGAAILSASAIDTRKPAARTAALSKPAASAYLAQVRSIAGEEKGGMEIAAWIARTNLVAH